MIVNSFEINDALQLTPLSAETVAEACQSTDARVWLDLQDAKTSELEAWMERLGIIGLARRLCLEAWDRPGFYPLKSEIIMVIPVLADPAISQEPGYITFLCRENLLLTMHRTRFLDSQRFIDEIQDSESWLSERSIAGLVAAIMIDLSQDGLGHTTKLRNSIRILEERMDREPDTVNADEILDVRSELLTLGAVVSDQFPALQALRAIDKPFFKIKDTLEFLNCAVANLQAASSSLDWLNGRIGALRSGFEMHAQDQTNRRLNMLTILAAIFNPATLLAGIWGMNFALMPELQYPLGYPIALGLIVLIGVLMFLFFRRGGWFD